MKEFSIETLSSIDNDVRQFFRGHTTHFSQDFSTTKKLRSNRELS